MLRLAVIADGNTRYLDVSEGVATLGSSRENDLVIRCSGVSRRHALVERRGERIIIRDSGSKNGLVVAGRRVDEVSLQKGTDVVIGRALLRLDEIDTGDAEVELLLDRLASTGSSLDQLTETATARTTLTRRLLRWIRLAERPTVTRAVLLEETRDFLGASTLMIVKGDSVIADIAGPLPPGEALRELSSATPQRWLACDQHGDAKLCAHFEAPIARSWRRDFLAFAASKLEDAPLVAAPDPEAELVFADGVVRGTSPAMAAVYEQVKQAVHSDLNVLLLGESGVGKEVIARLIHDSDPTRTGRFVAVNMTALTPSLAESELFGISGGVATDVQGRDGAFRTANGGTILLDEVADTSPELQAKLLRVVDSHAVTAVGASVALPIDVRIVAATNRDPFRLADEGAFRDDLLFRLNGFVISVPPLRARLEDIPALAKALAEGVSRRMKKPVMGFTTAAMRVLVDYPWPGNVRELKNVIERAVASCPKHGAIRAADLPALRAIPPRLNEPHSLLESSRSAAEVGAIENALRQSQGNVSEAARILGISRSTLHKLIRKHAIDV